MQPWRPEFALVLTARDRQVLGVLIGSTASVVGTILAFGWLVQWLHSL